MDTNGTLGAQAEDFLFRLATLTAKRATSLDTVQHYGSRKAYAGFLIHKWHSMLSFISQRYTVRGIQNYINYHISNTHTSCLEQNQ